MNRSAMLDVVVIGAGVVGSATALAMANLGLRVAIVEARQPTPWCAESPDLRVYALAPDAQALLSWLNVWSSIATARAHPYRKMRVWDAAGGDELVFDADALGRHALGAVVENDVLVDRLWGALLTHSGVDCYCPDQLQSVMQDAHGVQVELKSGQRLRARLLIGADGAGSRVRSLAGVAVAEHDYGQRGLVAFIKTEHAHQDTCWQRFLTTGPLALLPFSDGLSSIVWTLPDAEAERLLKIDEVDFNRELTRAFDARLGAMTLASTRAAFPLRRRLAESMRTGSILLVGDAAHAVHPLAGQGVNLGLRDVTALRDMVAKAKASGRDFAASHRLAQWARSRSSDNALSAYAFESINRVFSNDSVLPTLVRGHLLGLAGKLPPVAQWLWHRAAGI